MQRTKLKSTARFQSKKGSPHQYWHVIRSPHLLLSRAIRFWRLGEHSQQRRIVRAYCIAVGKTVTACLCRAAG